MWCAAGLFAVGAASAEEPQVAIERIEVMPAAPGPATLCRLEATVRNDGEQAVYRFGFDVEVLLLLSLLGVPTAVATVEATSTPRRSSVRVIRDGAGILRDLLRIRSRLRRGGYESTAASDG